MNLLSLRDFKDNPYLIFDSLKIVRALLLILKESFLENLNKILRILRARLEGLKLLNSLEKFLNRLEIAPST